MRAALVALAAAILSLTFPQISAAVPPAKPNIILIMADDVAWPAYGFMNAIDGTLVTPTQHPLFPPIVTPNLDRLAARGAVFPVGHSGASVCVPSFRSTLTGLYLKDIRQVNGLPKLPQFLLEAGYISYGFGKIWGPGYGPAGFTEGGIRSKSLPRRTIDPLFAFIDGLSPGGPPWFIWYSPKLPHSPFNAPRVWRDPYPPSIFPTRRLQHKGPKYYANITWLDFWVGKLLDGLQARGLDDQTLILYMSDNGFLLPHSKRRFTENGFRTPIMGSWPGVIPAGQVLPQMVHAIDFLPTMLDYAGLPLPANFEGQSMRPYLEGGASVPGRTYLFGVKPRPARRYLRTQDGMRFISRENGTFALFDLKVDPDEDNDVINDPAYQSIIPIWKQALDAWWTPR